MTEDLSWMDIDVRPGGKKLTRERTRAPSMRGTMLGKKRVWASDGEYVYFRRKASNPETLKRHNAFVATGDYQHVQTQDDVEIYKLMESSPFKRKEALNLAELDTYNVRRQVAIAACKRDWAGYLDALEELAGRIKGSNDPAFARLVWGETLQSIDAAIAMRQGPSQGEIDRELQAIRKRRGATAQRQIILPANMA